VPATFRLRGRTRMPAQLALKISVRRTLPVKLNQRPWSHFRIVFSRPTEPAAARGRRNHRRPRADPRRRRQRQDARHYLPHRLPDRAQRRDAGIHSGDDLHQQGRHRNGRARRKTGGRTEHRQARHLDIPFVLRAHVAPRHRGAAHSVQRPRSAGNRSHEKLRHL